MGENGFLNHFTHLTVRRTPFEERATTRSNTEESLKEDVQKIGAIGQVVAYSNFIWATFQLFLLGLNYFLDNAIHFGEVPGFAVLFGLAEASKAPLKGFRLFQMVLPFTFYQIMHIVLSDVFLTGITEVNEKKIDWYIMAYALTFGIEIIITVYGLAVLHTEFAFLVGTIIFFAFKLYTIFIARRLQIIFIALYKVQSSKINNRGQDSGPNVVDLEATGIELT